MRGGSPGGIPPGKEVTRGGSPGEESDRGTLGAGVTASEAVAVQKWRWPPQALAVAETRPRGPTGRVGAGLSKSGPPPR